MSKPAEASPNMIIEAFLYAFKKEDIRNAPPDLLTGHHKPGSRPKPTTSQQITKAVAKNNSSQPNRSINREPDVIQLTTNLTPWQQNATNVSLPNLMQLSKNKTTGAKVPVAKESRLAQHQIQIKSSFVAGGASIYSINYSPSTPGLPPI